MGLVSEIVTDIRGILKGGKKVDKGVYKIVEKME